MVNAYHTYKQQWTATDKKKMVKDASKALQVHFTTFILNLTAHGVCIKVLSHNMYRLSTDNPPPYC